MAFLQASASVLGDGVIWSQATSGRSFAGAGAALEIAARGADRFRVVVRAMRAVRESLVGHDSGERFPMIGGFAFADHDPQSPVWRGFPGARLIVPGVVVQQEHGRALLRITREVRPADNRSSLLEAFAELRDQAHEWLNSRSVETPPGRSLMRQSFPRRQAWEASVAAAVARIQAGAIDKVVLAREERVSFAAPLSPFAVLSRLQTADPGSTLFAMQSGDSWFLGSTPERLVRLDQGRVDVTCLAGSIAIGESPAERQRLAGQLLASAKDREEHEIVVRSTLASLEEVCAQVDRMPATPRVVAARSVQHLETPLTARLCRSGSVLDLVARLHPTPAVGGFPRRRAAAMIREMEEIDRGWYAGPFGWVDIDGSGEFVVAIRSGLLAGDVASLFAGCGIVAASHPREEFDETCLKLKPMLSALGAW